VTLREWAAESWTYRDVYYLLAWRDTKLRYKQTALGALWAILQPFLTMVLFTVVFGRLVQVPSDGLPYPIFYYAALLPWTYVSTTVTQSGLSLVGNARLVTKVYFPRSALPAAPVLSGMVDLGVGALLLAVLMAAYGLVPTWKVLLWPVLAVMLAGLACAVGAALAALNVRYRDVKHAVPFLMQLWLFATPIVYPASLIPASLQPLAALNPLAGIVSAFRATCAAGHPVDWTSLALSALVIAALLLASAAYFRRAEQGLSDVI
jgi:lipopolysaccharide transport system permease protein